MKFCRIVGFFFVALIVWFDLHAKPTAAANIFNDTFAILKTAATNVIGCGSSAVM